MISLIHRVRASIPSYIRETYPKLTEFIIDYYKYMEEEGVTADLIKFQENIMGKRDDPEYIRKFLTGLGFDMGVNLDLNPDLQYKIINDFFAMRGTEASLKLLFRLLFNEDVNIEYPRDKLLYLSQANYMQNIFIITTAPDNIVLPDITFSGVVGLSSKSTATIENIDIIVSDKKYFLIECSYATDKFTKDEVVRILFKDSTIDVVNVGAIDIDIENGGNGYKLYETVNVSGCIQTGVGYVSALTSGSIETLDIGKGGTGYAVGDKITAHNGFTASVTKVDDTTGAIEEVVIKHGGYKYREYPTLNYYTKNGKDAILTPWGSLVGGIKTISFENPYTLCSPSSVIGINTSTGYGFDGTLVVKGNIDVKKWTDKKGVLGVNTVLQDSDVNQEFSYKIISNVPSVKYIDLVDKFTHPYGFVRVPYFLQNVDMDLMLDQQVSHLIVENTKDVDKDIVISNLPTELEINTELTLEISVVTESETTVLYDDN